MPTSVNYLMYNLCQITQIQNILKSKRICNECWLDMRDLKTKIKTDSFFLSKYVNKKNVLFRFYKTLNTWLLMI